MQLLKTTMDTCNIVYICLHQIMMNSLNLHLGNNAKTLFHHRPIITGHSVSSSHLFYIFFHFFPLSFSIPLYLYKEPTPHFPAYKKNVHHFVMSCKVPCIFTAPAKNNFKYFLHKQYAYHTNNND